MVAVPVRRAARMKAMAVLYFTTRGVAAGGAQTSDIWAARRE
jgi:hypothetical protein